MLLWLKQFLCGLQREHDFHLRAGSGRIHQECYHCGTQRPGWTIDTARRDRLIRRRRTAEQDKKIVDMKSRRRA